MKSLLSELPCLSAPQVLDRLKETYPDLPEVADKTVYNFVMELREELSIPQEKDETRQMRKLPDSDYGKEAQVEWGEKNMMTDSGHWKKVYFFAMVMCRSRQKFVYFQDIPFMAEATAYAHHLAFVYFGGMPENVIYNQDAALIVCENLGDYRMTAEMESFRKSAGLSRSEYVRAGALNAEVSGVLSDEERMLLYELKKLGPNLNQIAHHANAGGYLSVAAKAEIIVDCIAGFILKLKNRIKI